MKKYTNLKPGIQAIAFTAMLAVFFALGRVLALSGAHNTGFVKFIHFLGNTMQIISLFMFVALVSEVIALLVRTIRHKETRLEYPLSAVTFCFLGACATAVCILLRDSLSERWIRVPYLYVTNGICVLLIILGVVIMFAAAVRLIKIMYGENDEAINN